MVVVEGTAGIGKSRLIGELRDRAADSGAVVLAANGSDLEREFPFGVVRQLFEPVLVAGRRDSPCSTGAAALGPRRCSAPSATTSPATATVVRRAARAVLADRQPRRGAAGSLLIVDDLHWCDRPSLRFLAYLARRLEGLPSLLVVGLRTAEPGTDPVLLGEIAARPRRRATSIPAAVRAGRRRADRATGWAPTPDTAFAEACRAATGGNPLLVRQLLSLVGRPMASCPRAAAGRRRRRAWARARCRARCCCACVGSGSDGGHGRPGGRGARQQRRASR